MGTKTNDIETFQQVVDFLRQNGRDPIILGEGDSLVAVSPHLAGKVMAMTSEGPDGWNPLFTKPKAMVDPDLSLAYDPEGGHRWWPMPEGQLGWSFYFPGFDLLGLDLSDEEKAREQLFPNWKVPHSFDKVTLDEFIGRCVDPSTNSNLRELTLRKTLPTIQNNMGNPFDIQVEVKYSIVECPEESGVKGLREVPHVGYTQRTEFRNVGEQTWNQIYGVVSPWSLIMLKSGNSWIILPVKEGTIDEVVDYRMGGDKKNQPVTPDRFLRRDTYGLFRADGAARGKLGLRPQIAAGYIAAIDLEHGLLTLMEVPFDRNAWYVDNRWIPAGKFKGTVIDTYNDSGDIAGGGEYSMFELEGVCPVRRFLKPKDAVRMPVTVHQFKTDPSNIELLYGVLNRMTGVDLTKESYRA